jgi:8-oxo-dGTP diphosphatase
MQVAVGVILNKKREVLIAQRPPGKYQSGLWEFPGGKVEENETSYMALQRELLEEVGITVIDSEFLLQVPYNYVDRKVLLDAWLVTQFVGEPGGKENQLVQWVSVRELNQFEFPAGNKFIIEKLKIYKLKGVLA